MGKKINALTEAALAFDSYAKQHLAKTPPQHTKAEHNIQLAAMCFNALGQSYKIPKAPAVRPERPAESDSALKAYGDAKTLLQDVHWGASVGEPIKGFELNLDDMPILNTLIAVGFARRDETTDIVAITAAGRDWLGIKPEGALDLPVTVAEVTGNIDERELAARYLELKIGAIDSNLANHKKPKYGHDVSWVEAYQYVAVTLKAAADEFREGLHLPAVHIEGRVIPYNEDRSTGVLHQETLSVFFNDVYQRNVKAGWWTDIETGLPKKRNLGELMMLICTELAEAYNAWADNANDDKLPEYPGLGVELGDTLIRLADLCGAAAEGNLVGPNSESDNPGESLFFQIIEIAEAYERIRKTPAAKGTPETSDFIPAMDVAEMVDKKLAFNATRADHKIENRLKEGGKQT